MSDHTITLTVDGTREELTVPARTLLVHALRDELDYTGPNVGCETGKCGACTVEVDGDAVKSCTLLAVQVDGSEITTVEGLAEGRTDDGRPDDGRRTDEPTDPDDPDVLDVSLDPIQDAFSAEHGLQCGYCTPGMLMTTRQLLAENPDPSREEIRTALKGNICRCTGYQNIVDAVQSAAKSLGDRPPEQPTGGDD